MTDRKVTLSEVAKRAGVSLGAASKVLNGGTSKIGVGAEARKRILEAARQLNYHTNMAASILAGGSSKLIGVFIDSFANYRNTRLLQEIELTATRLGFRIMTSFSHDNIANMKEDYLLLQSYSVWRFICLSHDYPDMKDQVSRLFSGSEDVVFMEKPCVPDMPYVQTSRVKALTAMIADAIRKGYRKIGLLRCSMISQSELSLNEEFRLAMKNNGLKTDENLIFEYPVNILDPVERIRLAMEKMILPNRPDFLYVDDAIHTAPLWTQLQLKGLNIGIYGGNGDPLFHSLNQESFDPCYDQIAAELFRLLLHPESRNEVPVIEASYRKCNFNSNQKYTNKRGEKQHETKR